MGTKVRLLGSLYIFVRVSLLAVATGDAAATVDEVEAGALASITLGNEGGSAGEDEDTLDAGFLSERSGAVADCTLSFPLVR